MTKRTTVDLTEKGQKVKDLLCPVYGLKNILSASLVLFSKLSAEEREQVIAEANGVILEPEKAGAGAQKEALQNAVKVIKEMTEVERQQPGTIYRVLTHDEQQVIDDFRKAIEPHPKKTSKRKKTVCHQWDQRYNWSVLKIWRSSFFVKLFCRRAKMLIAAGILFFFATLLLLIDKILDMDGLNLAWPTRVLLIVAAILIGIHTCI